MNRTLPGAINSPLCRIQNGLKANTKLAVILALATLLTVPLFPFTSSVNSQTQAQRPASSMAYNSVSALPARFLTKPSQAQLSRVYNPYWYLDKKTTATLEITNNVDTDRTLTPVLLLRGTERVSLEPVTVRASSERGGEQCPLRRACGPQTT